MPTTNPFAVFSDSGDSGTSCPMRKAHKKVREIEKLKQKMNKTPEEYNKIQEESYWRAIVEPVLTDASERPEDIEQRKTKQREKSQIKDLKRKLDIQKEKYKREKASMQRKWQEDMHLLQEEIRHLKLENHHLKLENQQVKKRKCSSFNYNADAVSMEEKIEDEFLELYQQKGSYKQTYKEMIMKYHPDKNSTEIGHKITTILNILKDRYVD
tara:strand:- start:3194 stop:3829 length:636 start_codon:yes stop_codon:yes gene_type:complete